jgi:NAD(P)H-hydrate epimerase
MIRLTRAQVREIDRRAIEQYHIPGIVLMENAALAATDVACAMLDDNCIGEVLVLCGGGNNGGDGLAIARHLHNRGAAVTIGLTTDPSNYRGDSLINWKIVQAMNLPTRVVQVDEIARFRGVLIIDAIFGTGLSERPRPPFDQIAAAVNASTVPVLAIDMPSGLDCDSGQPLGACIKAAETITFVAHKVGFDRPSAQQYLGDVTVGDIGCPVELVEQVMRRMPGA